MRSSDKTILTLKISVTNFGRFLYFADFDIKNVLLRQKFLELIAFFDVVCSVLCISNLY